jgi:hypothetical protein
MVGLICYLLCELDSSMVFTYLQWRLGESVTPLKVILCIASYSSLFMFLKCSGKSYLLVGCLNIASYAF